MAIDEIEKGTISKILRLFIQDSSSAIGAGLRSLAFDTVGLTAHFLREGDPGPPSGIPLVSAVVGTYTSSGFIEISSGEMPGVYEFHTPDLVLASGADSVVLFLQGATDMAPLPVEIKLTDAGSVPPTAAAIADQVWDENLNEHQLSGSMGQTLGLANITTDIDAIADAVWDENLNEHQLSGSTGQALGLADTTSDVVAIADAVWDENLNEHQLSGSMGQALGLADTTSDVVAIADAVWDETLADHQLSGSTGAALSNAAQTGTGNILVDHDFGGVDNLRVIDTTGAPVDEALIQAFLKVDFDAGSKGVSFVRGQTQTGSDGRWLSPMALDPDTYVLTFNKPTIFVGNTIEITVS